MVTKSIPVRLTDELLAKLDKMAAAQRRNRSQLLRLIVEDAVAAYEKESGPIKL